MVFFISSTTAPYSFQFHTGSIKRRSLLDWRYPNIVRFNSTLVRLKASLPTLHQAGMASFNSTLVRLKVGRPIAGVVECVEFQFHTGSIKSVAVSPERVALPVFQFHTGSIKSGQKSLVGLFGDRCFNSTLVRLKVVFLRLSRLAWVCFNSTLVRLKGSTFRSALLSSSKFQFHTGSIKSGCAV